MARSQYGPAAGAPGGAEPRLAALHTPQFLRLEAVELVILLNVLRDPLAVHLYLLLLAQMRYTEGHFLGTYARLMDLMTPPAPERGRRRGGPTYKRVRDALADLVEAGLVRRDERNESQGQLRLWLAARGTAKTKKKTA
ncbi:MAG TPA: hypothetical protein PLA33_01765 [Ottowia sp.]|nr:hypothetical protein [Ottowia sp.]HNL40834.1 hypothetical protein [Ottowia sp.]HNO41344.1 hypothetical protein [Ottowia sp.]